MLRGTHCIHDGGRLLGFIRRCIQIIHLFINLRISACDLTDRLHIIARIMLFHLLKDTVGIGERRIFQRVAIFIHLVFPGRFIILAVGKPGVDAIQISRPLERRVNQECGIGVIDHIVLLYPAC